MRQHTALTHLAPILLVLSFAATRPAEGQVPVAADFAACNEEASQALKAGTASPTADDHARAASARGDAMTPTPDAPGKIIESSNPQTHGMDAEGAKDALYQAAYRSCMRRKGF